MNTVRDSLGNVFYVESIIEKENDPEELKMLIRALMENKSDLDEFRKRAAAWSKSETTVATSKEGHDVNYHWGFHAGRVSMAKEATEALK